MSAAVVAEDDIRNVSMPIMLIFGHDLRQYGIKSSMKLFNFPIRRRLEGRSVKLVLITQCDDSVEILIAEFGTAIGLQVSSAMN